MKIPVEISPCPIEETVVELRFDSTMPADAVFGVLYKEFGDDYEGVEKLPILQLPEPIRSQDVNLRFKPHYNLKSENYLLRIGPKVISVMCKREYVGWQNYFTHIKDSLIRIEKLKVVENVRRLGLRYVNLFQDDIFNKINLEFIQNGNPFNAEQFYLRSVVKAGDLNATLQIHNDVQLEDDKVVTTKSILDIDVFKEFNDDVTLSGMPALIDQAHTEEKTLFFGLLKDSFLKELNPKY